MDAFPNFLMLMAKGGMLEQNSTPEAKFHNKPLDHTSLHVVTYDGWHLSGLGLPLVYIMMTPCMYEGQCPTLGR